MQFSSVQLSDLSDFSYQCGCGRLHAFPSRIFLSYFGELRQVAESLFPHGRLLVLYSGECMIAYARVFEAALSSFYRTVAVPAEGDGGNLFSLYDDVVGVVTMGNASVISQARAFATLRNIPLLAVSSGLDHSSVFSKKVRLSTVAGSFLFSAKPPEVLFTDENVLKKSVKNASGVYARAFSSKITVLDRHFSEFFGQETCKNLTAVAERIGTLSEQVTPKNLYFAELLYCFFFGEEGQSTADALAALLAVQTKKDRSLCYFTAVAVLVRLYGAFLTREDAYRRLLVDYAARLQNAKAAGLLTEAELLCKMRIPTPEEQRLREGKFFRQRGAFRMELEHIQAKLPSFTTDFCRFGGKIEAMSESDVRKALSLLPEFCEGGTLAVFLRDCGVWLF